MLIQMSKYFDRSPELVSMEEFKSYLFYCKDKLGRSNSFINQTISALKILRQDVLGLDWEAGVKIRRPRGNHQLPVILSKQEVKLLIDCTPNLKHKAILAMLYSTGMRREELLNLRLVDVDRDRMIIRITHGKGNKSRDALLAQKTLELLIAYYQSAYPKPTTYVFEGAGQPGQPYSATSVGKIVKRARLKSGIKKVVSPHSLRHAFATHMLEQGTNLKLIQKLLGHSSMSSTMVYLHTAAIDPSVKSPIDLP